MKQACLGVHSQLGIEVRQEVIQNLANRYSREYYTVRRAVKFTSKEAAMKRTFGILVLVLIIGIAAGLVGCQAGAKTEQEPVKLTVLSKTAELPGVPGKESTTFTVEVAPGKSTIKHYHPGHEWVYVAEGSGVVETDGMPSMNVKAGMGFFLYSDPPPAKPAYAHLATNTSKKDPLKFLVVLVADKGQPLLIPVK
jgi:quercetin dioxygenase-like cupin family protein